MDASSGSPSMMMIPSIVFRTNSGTSTSQDDGNDHHQQASSSSPRYLESFSSSFPEEITSASSSVMGEETINHSEQQQQQQQQQQRVVPLGGDVIRKRPSRSAVQQLNDKMDHFDKRFANKKKQLDEELFAHEQIVASTIEHAGTFTTGDNSEEPEHDDNDDDDSSSSLNQSSCDGLSSALKKREAGSSPQKKSSLAMEESAEGGEDDDTRESSEPPALGCTCNQTKFLYWIYISAGSVIGGTLRVYLSRLFGEDCELAEASVEDVFTSFFSRICLTAGGRTMQTGGALFRDWPANLLGCFLMGMLTSDQYTSPFPWFHKDHSLQRNKFLHAAFGVGLCGCMTTFASWNSQMVVMMDGTYTELGPQIVAALFGYILGMMGCISSFRVGRITSAWMYPKVNTEPDGGSDDMSQLSASFNGGEKSGAPQQQFSTSPIRKICRPIHLLHLTAVLIVCLFVVGVCISESIFYKNMTLVSLLGPLGALSRWKLANWNSSRHPKIHKKHLPWLPWGTLLANLTGAVISIACEGVLDRHSYRWSDWMNAFLFAIKVGFAGSLSTVSTLVKEIVGMEATYPGHAKPFIYGTCTCVGGMTAGLIVYMLIVRIQ